MGIIGNCVRVTALLVLVMATSNRCAPIPATTGLAQGQLPPCPDQRHSITSPWSNCVGTFTYRDGKKYVGEWRDNKRNGQGTITFANGTQYVGEFRDNKLYGQGTLALADGSKYVGEFRDDYLRCVSKNLIVPSLADLARNSLPSTYPSLFNDAGSKNL